MFKSHPKIEIKQYILRILYIQSSTYAQNSAVNIHQ